MSRIFKHQAPAKLNLFLHVTGRRDDGYHLLQSLFVPIALYDELSFSLTHQGKVRRLTTIPGIAEEDDLVVKAAYLLKAHVERPALGVDIGLKKNIPSGAGLGGGSSDAATTLLVLNELWGLQLSKEELLPLALQLGADVPFFLYCTPAVVEGIGEQIVPLEQLGNRLNKVHYVLFVPKLAIPTVSIFKDPDLTRDTSKLSLEELSEALKLMKQPWRYGQNDLEPVACKQHLVLAELAGGLRDLGVEARMSGAGSVFYAASPTREEAELIHQRVEGALNDLPLSHPLNALEMRCIIVAAHTEN